jgi:hypothetical protein
MRARAEVDCLPTSGKEPKRMAAGFVLPSLAETVLLSLSDASMQARSDASAR